MNDYECKHNKILRDMGAECTVLLKKDGKFPLSSAGEIALYGSGVRNTIKGGTGSGEVNSRFFVTIEQGLEEEGFHITSKDWLDDYERIRSEAKKKFLSDLKVEAKKKHQNVMILSMGRSMPEPEYELPIIAGGKTGIYVLSRISGEGNDRAPAEGEIYLSKTEICDIRACNEKYENFMLVLNTGGVVDLSPVMDVKNILLFSQLGVESGHILADILLGRQSPSGKLSTTWSAWKDYPVIGDFGEKDDTCYREGIYVGYRYFDSVKKNPLFPFGYGLTYTEFQSTVESISLDQDVVTVTVHVQNKGAYAAKEVEQLYVTIPEGKLDQPYQILAGFAKTELLEPGQEQKIGVTFSMKDIAPYDQDGECYILEAGNYLLRVGNSSRNTVIAGVVKVENTITVMEAKNVLDAPEFSDYRIPEEEKAECSTMLSDGIPVVTLHADVIKTIKADYTHDYEINPELEKLSDEQLVKMNLGAFDPKGGIASMIGNSGLTVAGAAGQSCLELEKFGVSSLVMADGPAGLRLAREYAVDKKGGVHNIGNPFPESLTVLMPKPMKWLTDRMGYKQKKTDQIKNQYATALPIGTAIAQSFNVGFAEQCGRVVGEEMKLFGVHLWLAPALNIHRSIRCGRNFEYFSEDPLLSGMMAGYITRGVQSFDGCGTTIKHYACNNQETNRIQNSSVLSERAAREIYLKGFGIAIIIGQPKAVMTSYNLINGVHTSEHTGLIEDILRKEYGFRGIVITDWITKGYKMAEDCAHPVAKACKICMAGGDLIMPGSKEDYEEVLEGIQKGTVTKKQLLINASRVVKMADELVKGKR